MSEHPLYQAVLGQLNAHLDPMVCQSTRERVALLVTGIISSESASPARIARVLHQMGVSEAQVESIERRIRRIENDPEVSAGMCFHRMARHYLALGQMREVRLAIDPTTQDERVVMLTVSVIYRGRSLPLAWAVWAGNRPLTGARFWERVAALLGLVATLLPAHVPVTIVADRAFGTPKFTDLVQAKGWHYVVRVQGHTHYRDRLGQRAKIRSLVRQAGQRRKLRGQVFKKRHWREASVLVYWSRRQAAPLCLVTDLPPDWAVLALYRQRYTIEALFREFKSAGWHWEQSQVTDLAHLERLLVGMALAFWLAVMVGTQVVAEYLDAHPVPSRRSLPAIAKYSLFQLGLQRLLQWAAHHCRLPLQWHLFQWNAPTWQSSLAQRLTLARLFGSCSWMFYC